MTTRHSTLSRAIAAAGSQAKLAALSGISQSSISRMLIGRERISAEDAVALERATGIARSEFRPDLWPAAPIASSEVRA